TWSGNAYAGVAGLIQSGRNGGDWSGNGIVTAAGSGDLTTLAIAEASMALGPSGGVFDGETVDASAVLIKFTYGGDANLDGKLDIADYGLIDLNSPLGSSGWFNGDFNYDGVIDIRDYGVIDFNLPLRGATL